MLGNIAATIKEGLVMESTDHRAILGMITHEQVLKLEQAAIRIPSPTFNEQELADYLANYMSDMGLEVEMQEVQHPFEQDKKSRQPIGRLKGTGEGPSLMLNGHMDPRTVLLDEWTVDPFGGEFKDGWIYGLGAMDDKGGIISAICAVEALKRSGAKLKGEILVCPVIAHKAGGIGTRELIKRGILTDYCINLEHSANGIAIVCVGIVKARISTKTPQLFFRYSPESKAKYFNSIEQMCEIIWRLGSSLDPIQPGTWLRFTPHPELPGFPQFRLDTIHKDFYSRECELEFQIRTVPGQCLENIKTDLTRLLEKCKAERPNIEYELSIPAEGEADTWYMEPMEISRDNPLVVALAEGHRIATNVEPVVGSETRIGNVGDGNLLSACGVATLQYGPGDIRELDEWPSPDERVRLDDLVNSAKAIAYASYRLCG
jgi:acetylornithine deacetylase/succinyl-diaminopimelate desuccinylase-like protein